MINELVDELETADEYESQSVCISTESLREIIRQLEQVTLMQESLARVLEEKAPAYHDCTDNGESECAWCQAENALNQAKGDV